jgi:uncharacterized tellurite resistance protein B-like protein
MIGKLKALLSPLLAEPGEQDSKEQLDLAVAVLLVEMARADHRLDPTEEREIQAQLEQGFGLQSGPAAALLSRAREAVENAVSLHEFTRAIHETMDYAEKQRVIEMLWRVALADRNLDKYEDYLIGKLGELLYVSRGDVIRLKNQVMEQLRARDG